MPKLMTPLSIATDGYIIDLFTGEWMYASIFFKATILQNNYMTVDEKSANIVNSRKVMKIIEPIMTIHSNPRAKILCHI